MTTRQRVQDIPTSSSNSGVDTTYYVTMTTRQRIQDIPTSSSNSGADTSHYVTMTILQRVQDIPASRSNSGTDRSHYVTMTILQKGQDLTTSCSIFSHLRLAYVTVDSRRVTSEAGDDTLVEQARSAHHHQLLRQRAWSPWRTSQCQCHETQWTEQLLPEVY